MEAEEDKSPIAHEVSNSFPTPKADQTYTYADILPEEIAYYNEILVKLKSAWEQSDTPKDICMTAMTTIKVLEHRRKALLLPFGASRKDFESKEFVYLHDD